MRLVVGLAPNHANVNWRSVAKADRQNSVAPRKTIRRFILFKVIIKSSNFNLFDSIMFFPLSWAESNLIGCGQIKSGSVSGARNGI